MHGGDSSTPFAIPMNPHLYTATLVALLALSSPTGAQSEERHHPDFEELSARWSRVMEELPVPGLALVIVEGDEGPVFMSYATRLNLTPINHLVIQDEIANRVLAKWASSFWGW